MKISIIFVLCILLASCSSVVRFSSNGEINSEGKATGKASYYADKYHGRKTANGEIFDMNDFTAAHRTLPFNTQLKVTNLKNGKSVIVRINDRGPFVADRIIDLSKAAAEEIDMIKSGVAEVEIQIVK